MGGEAVRGQGEERSERAACGCRIAGTSTVNTRVFDIQVHDQTLLRFDIIAAAGATTTAVFRDFAVTVPGNTVNVSFRMILDNPVVNGTSAECTHVCQTA